MVSSDEPAQRGGIEPAVGMCDEGQGDGVDSREVLEFTFSQLGQLMVVTLRQVLANLAKLFLDDMEIINQPLRRG